MILKTLVLLFFGLIFLMGVVLVLAAPFVQGYKLKKNNLNKSARINWETQMQIKVGFGLLAISTIFGVIANFAMRNLNN